MNRFFIPFLIFFLSNSVLGQTELSEYDFVVVPAQFGFLNEDNQYQLNDMAQFYLEKKGFVVISANEVPENRRCKGLYADVEQIKTLFGTKLQFLLNDCNKKEIFRSEEGRSKFKEFEKAYQDALRKTMENLPQIIVKSNAQNELFKKEDKIKTADTSEILPSLQTYQKDGKSFLIRKTSNGHALYEESHTGDLHLIGNFIDDSGMKFIDNEDSLFDVEIDENSNLIFRNKDGKEQKFLRN